MKRTVNLTKFDNEFVFHFGGEFHRVNVETFAKSMLELSSALKEINRVVNPDTDIEVCIDALGKGSFRTRIVAIAKNSKPLFGGVSALVLAPLLVMCAYDKIRPDDDEVSSSVINNFYIVESNDFQFVLPTDAEPSLEKIDKNIEVDRHISEAFKTLHADEEIHNFGITENLNDTDSLVEFPRSDFARLSEVREFVIGKEDGYREIEESANLLIIKAIFVRGMRKWQFTWRNELIISAAILDDSFYDKLDDREYVIGKGDTLQVILKIYQHKDDIEGVWINNSYEILKVLGHTPRPEQSKIFSDE